VYWLPTPDIAGKVPEEIVAMQRASHAHGPKYNEFGLKKIIHQPKQYRQAVEVIAQHCRIAWNKSEQLPNIDIAPLKTIKPAFPLRAGATHGERKPSLPAAQPVGPRFARFLFVVASQDEIAKVRQNYDRYGSGGSAWIPYSAPTPSSAGLIAQDAATRSHLER